MNNLAKDVSALEHAALGALGIGAWEWDLVEDRITWSDVVHRMFGVHLGSFVGGLSEILELIHPADRERFRAELRRVRAEGSDWDLTHRVNLSGHERWVRSRGRVERDASWRALKIVGVIEDVTVTHALEADRGQQTELMQTALDASLFAVVVLDTSGQIIYSNQLAASLLGLTRSVVETRAYDAPQFKHTDVSGGPWPEEKQPFVQVMRTGAAVQGVEHRIERPDGRVITLRINGAPIKNDRGEIKLVVCSFEDISERRAAEEALRQTQKLEAIGRLAGAVAHDFNNLVAAIQSYASLAHSELDQPARVTEYLDGISEACARATQLTRQLLAFGRRDVNQPTYFDARDEVSKAAQLFTRTMTREISFQLDLDERPCFVFMDPNQLQQVLLNLAVNARDAMLDGGTLRLSVERTEHETVLLRVSDTGQGMDELTRRRAFEPFFTTKPANEGTGLGLATCHGIITQAGGQIRLFSEPGRGTRVEIELPRARANAAR